MSNLYTDPNLGAEVVTHSSLKVFRRCPKQYDYKYLQRLKPVTVGVPLKRGVWMHELLEVHHQGLDWRDRHRELCRKYDELLDDEKDHYGDLPNELAALMRSYVWYYKDDPWTVVETEFTIETELPNGVVYRGRVDALVENQFGLWVADHKTHRTLPDLTFRLLDAQSALYLWALLRKKFGVRGFVWNYLRTTPPSKPRVVKAGDRLYKNLGDTDYLTYGSEIKRLLASGELLKATPEIKAKLAQLKEERYRPGEIQTSPFFRRDYLEKQNDLLRRVAQENYTTVRRIMQYDFSKPDAIERVVDRSCSYMCAYKDLCAVELLGGNPNHLRRSAFRVGDPMDYYQDNPNPHEEQSV